MKLHSMREHIGGRKRTYYYVDGFRAAKWEYQQLMDAAHDHGRVVNASTEAHQIIDKQGHETFRRINFTTIETEL